MKRWIGWRIAGIAVWMTAMMATMVQAQQPTVVLSIRGIEELLGDADFIGEEVGQAGLKEVAENLIAGLTGGKGLAGIDQEKPLGLYLNVSAIPEMPVVFLPVADAAALKGLLKELAPDFKETSGTWSFTINGSKLFAKISGEYCFVSPAAAGLAKPADPKKIVNSKYDLAVDVSIGSIPKPYKEMFLNQTEESGRQALEAGPAPESKAEEVGRDFGFNGTLAALKSLTNDGDKLTFGIDINSETRLASTDFSVTAKAATELAKSMTAFGKTTPAFAGIGSDSAALRMVFSFPTTGVLEQLDKLFDAMRESADEEIAKDERLDTEAERTAARNVAKRLLDIAQATVKSGSMHSGIVIEPTDDGLVRVVAGTRVAQGEDAGKLLDDVMKLSKESPELGKVKADVAKYSGARIHSITSDSDDAEKYFGKEPAHLAIRNDSMWFALGGDNLTSLKKGLDLLGKTGARTTGGPISLQVKPAQLVTLMEKEDEDLIERAKKIAGTPGDKLSIDVTPIANGAKLRIEFGVDLFKLSNNEGSDDIQ